MQDPPFQWAGLETLPLQTEHDTQQQPYFYYVHVLTI